MTREPVDSEGLHGELAAWLAEKVGGGPWRLSRLGGSGDRALLAEDAAAPSRERLVVRLDASAAVLEQVARIGVGPSVIGEGVAAGRTFVAQPFAGTAVDGPWIRDHADAVAALVARYQADPVLAGLAPELSAEGLAADLVAAVERMPATLRGAAVRTVERVAATAGSLEPAPLVASHGDPNASNLLLDDRLGLIDWDDLRLADPMRDLGPLAWWYLPPDAWSAFLFAAGADPTPAAISRLWWWVAAESFDVACRLADRDPEAASGFIADAVAAIDRQPNPRRT